MHKSLLTKETEDTGYPYPIPNVLGLGEVKWYVSPKAAASWAQMDLRSQGAWSRARDSSGSTRADLIALLRTIMVWIQP